MEFRQVIELYLHEVRCALRERNIVVYSLVLPVVMYPALLWAGFAGLSFVQGQADRLPSRVAALGPPPAHQALIDTLDADQDVVYSLWTESVDVAVEAIADGRLDALIEFNEPDSAGAALPGNFRIELHYNQARDRSGVARERVVEAAVAYRGAWLDRERRGLGVGDATWEDFGIVREDLASSEDITRFILGLFIPVLTMIMVAMATFYPAVDATAGERERSTWETLMTVAAPRSTVATAKYLYVATFGLAGGLLNLFALVISMRWILRPPAGGATDELMSTGIPLGAIPVIGLGAGLTALFVAAIMLALAAFARTFKEGQSMITPFYFLLIIPAFFLQSPDTEFTLLLAATPVVNVIMVIREAIMGTYQIRLVALTFTSQIVIVVASIAFAQWVLSNEDVLMGTQEGGLGKFLKGRLKARRAAP